MKVHKILSFVATSLVIIGCSSGNNSSMTANPITTSGITCPAGQLWNGSVCVTNTTTSTGPIVGNFRFGVTNCNGLSCGNTSTFTVTNAGIYEDFLEKALGVCSSVRTSGYYDCHSWWPGQFQLSIQGSLNPNNACFTQTGQETPASISLYMQAGYIQSSGFFYGTQIFSTYYPYNNGMTFNATASNINQCRGFTIRQYFNRYPFELQVVDGNLKNGTLNFVLYWGSNSVNPSAEFARGVLSLY